MNMRVQLVFQLAYVKAAVQHFSHYAIEALHPDPIDKIPTGTTTSGQSGPGSNDKEGFSKLPKIGASPSDTKQYHSQDTPFVGDHLNPSAGDIVSEF